MNICMFRKPKFQSFIFKSFFLCEIVMQCIICTIGGVWYVDQTKMILSADMFNTSMF